MRKNRLPLVTIGAGIVAAIAVLVIGAIMFVTFMNNTLNQAEDSQKHGDAPDIHDTSKWGLVFSDDFNGSDGSTLDNKLDNKKWTTCYDWQNPAVPGCTNGGNFEQEWYLPEQVAVKNGQAVLTAEAKPITVWSQGSQAHDQSKTGIPDKAQSQKKSQDQEITYPYRSGMISTGRANPSAEPKWSATYGYFEARMQVEGGKGVWPAFWLLPIDKSWPPEIDIMELLGDRPDQILLTSHWIDEQGNRQKDSTTITGGDYTKGWHTYAVNWQPNRIDWYIDNELKKTVTGNSVPNKPMEIIINLAIGGLLPGNADATTPFPRIVRVDYVRAYGMKL